MKMTKSTEERAHSKFPASGSERYLNCAASVELEEMSPPSVDTVWSLEGTQAHDLLDARLKAFQFPTNELGELDRFNRLQKEAPLEMRNEIEKVFKKIIEIKWKCDGELSSDRRVFNRLIHPEMFGTLDVEIFRRKKVLHIIDLKYGKGHIVTPKNNTQLIQYALAVSEEHDFDFPLVVVHIMQPRAGKNWHKYSVIPMTQMKRVWLPYFQERVRVIEHEWTEPNPGNWCYWCRANKKGDDGQIICPAKRQVREEKVVSVFEQNPLKGNHEKERGKKDSTKVFKAEGAERQTKSVRFGKIE